MKKITIVLVLFFLNIGNSFCQESGKFLVFTFNCVYEIGEYKHGTGDNLWIIPYDSCLTNFSDRKLTPLFVDDYLINSLSDSITNISVSLILTSKYIYRDQNIANAP